jgi:hypothetical protein
MTAVEACAWCGEPALPPGHTGPDRKEPFCSQTCRVRLSEKRHGRLNQPHTSTAQDVTKPCAGCRKDFTYRQGRGRPPKWCESCRETPYRMRQGGSRIDLLPIPTTGEGVFRWPAG